MKNAFNSCVTLYMAEQRMSEICYISIETYKTEIQRDKRIEKSVRVLVLIERSVQFSSVQFSRSVVSDSLRPHQSQK